VSVLSVYGASDLCKHKPAYCWENFLDDEVTLDDDQRMVLEEAPSAEWIFEGKVKKEDYHRNMNSDNFMLWIEQRLIPAIRAKYPGKKAILVLDNAPYHWGRDENFVDPNTTTRTRGIEFLRTEAKMTEIVVQRENGSHTFNLERAATTKRGSKHAPYAHEIRAAMSEYLKTRPDLQRSRLQALFDELGWKLIFTPPYTPSLQPIEMVWAYVKWWVREAFRPGRNMKRLLFDIQNGFYGCEEEKGITKAVEGVTEERCMKYISKAHRHMNEFIAADPQLDGTIFDLIELPDRPLTEEENEELEELLQDGTMDNSDRFSVGGVPESDSDDDSDEEYE